MLHYKFKFKQSEGQEAPRDDDVGGILTYHPVALAHSTREANATLLPDPLGPLSSILVGEEEDGCRRRPLSACMLLRCMMASAREAATSSCCVLQQHERSRI